MSMTSFDDEDAPTELPVFVTFTGTNGANVIDTAILNGGIFFHFDAWVNGFGGHDLISTGFGNDTSHGGFGNDTLLGNAGDDWLQGDEGRDSLVGGDGHDQLDGGAGADTLDGGAGGDVANGGDGNDYIIGGDGNDWLFGGTGFDRIAGGAGDDFIIVEGGVGNGGAGNDTLVNLGHTERLLGGPGADRVVLSLVFDLTSSDSFNIDISHITANGGGGMDTFYIDDLFVYGGADRSYFGRAEGFERAQVGEDVSMQGDDFDFSVYVGEDATWINLTFDSGLALNIVRETMHWDDLLG